MPDVSFANNFVPNHLDVFPFQTGKVVGHDQWGVKHKHYTTMSEAMVHVPNSVTDKRLFLPSTEAYAYIMLDNCYVKWEAMCKHYAKKGDWGAPIPKKVTKVVRELAKSKENVDEDATDDGTGSGKPLEDADIEAIDKLHKAKYSSPDEGQQKFGSFSKQGRQEHGRVLNMILKASKDAKKKAEDNGTPNTHLQVELDFLKKYREANNIIGKNHEDQCRIKGKNRKRKAGDGLVVVEDEAIGKDEEKLAFDSDDDEE